MTGITVIGVGNAYRGDDGLGPAVTDALRGRAPSSVSIVECEQELSRLLDAWEGAGAAIVVDAIEPGDAPGGVHRFDATAGPIPARPFRSSTHAFGVGEAIELGRALGRLPRVVIVYGIEGVDFTAGEELSPSVAAGVEAVANAILSDIERLQSEETACTSTP